MSPLSLSVISAQCSDANKNLKAVEKYFLKLDEFSKAEHFRSSARLFAIRMKFPSDVFWLRKNELILLLNRKTQGERKGQLGPFFPSQLRFRNVKCWRTSGDELPASLHPLNLCGTSQLYRKPKRVSFLDTGADYVV